MKKSALVLNIILALAVVALYILYFTGTGAPKKSAAKADFSGSVKAGSDIYYVQIDSVIANYDMAKDLADKLETKFNSSDAALKTRQDAYQKDVNDYQYKIQRGLVTRADAQGIEQQLMAKQQDLMKLQQDLTNEINEQQVVMNRQVINAIMEYMKENSAEYNYKYVLGTSFGGNILYANDSLDITRTITEGLNLQYKSEKEKK